MTALGYLARTCPSSPEDGIVRRRADTSIELLDECAREVLRVDHIAEIPLARHRGDVLWSLLRDNRGWVADPPEHAQDSQWPGTVRSKTLTGRWLFETMSGMRLDCGRGSTRRCGRRRTRRVRKCKASSVFRTA
jgi:hypothetical protein